MTVSEFFASVPRAAIAFSGGVDSAYLLYEAVKCKADVVAYYVNSEFQPRFELEDAVRLADELGAKLRVIKLSVLSNENIAANGAERCYHCKREIFSAIEKAAREDGFNVLLDGTNASDDEGDRPGMRALRELSVRSPLRECSLTKADVRKLSRAAGLFTWNKPAYACLATRIQTGERINAEKLERTEKAEDRLHALGFKNFRVRLRGNNALLQLGAEDMEKLWQNKAEIFAILKEDYKAVWLDLEVRSEQ